MLWTAPHTGRSGINPGRSRSCSTADVLEMTNPVRTNARPDSRERPLLCVAQPPRVTALGSRGRSEARLTILSGFSVGALEEPRRSDRPDLARLSLLHLKSRGTARARDLYRPHERLPGARSRREPNARRSRNRGPLALTLPPR